MTIDFVADIILFVHDDSAQVKSAALPPSPARLPSAVSVHKYDMSHRE